MNVYKGRIRILRRKKKTKHLLKASNITNNIKNCFEKLLKDLAGVAQWIECWPANQRVAG